MDLRTEMIKNKKTFDEIKEYSDVGKLNKRLTEFKNELEMHFKGMKKDTMGNDFNAKLLQMQKDLDELRNSLSDTK